MNKQMKNVYRRQITVDGITMFEDELIDRARPELGRSVRVTRELPVEQLTPQECKALLVHCHECSRERHDAYYKKWFDWFKSPAGRAADEAEIQRRKELAKR